MKSVNNAVWVLLGLSLGVLAARATPAVWSSVFDDAGEVRFLGVDPYYHLRHAQFAAQNFPSLQRWDVGTDYPDGQRSDAAGLFDLVIGGTAWLVGLGNPTGATVELVCAWVPPVLAAISVSVLYLLACTMMCRRAAIAVCAVFVLHPGPSLQRTMLGFADHHCAEIVLILTAALALARGLDRDGGDHSARSHYRPDFLRASPMAVLLFTWAGAPLYLLITAATLWLISLMEVLRHSMAPSAAYSVRYGTGLLLLVLVPGYLWPDLVMNPDRFGPIMLGCAGVAMGPLLCHLIARSLSYAQIDRRVIFAALLLLAPGVSWYATVHVYEVESLVSELLHKSIAVVEHQTVTAGSFFRMLGVPGLFALLSIPFVLLRVLQSSDYRLILASFVPGMSLAGVWLLARDFEYLSPPFIALFAVLFLLELKKRLPLGRFSSPIGSRVSVCVAAAMMIAPIWPFEFVNKPWVTTQVVQTHMMINDGWSQAMTWMRSNTPPPTVGIDAPAERWSGPGGFQYPAGTYGVLSPWDYGNMIAVLGRRVPVASRYPTERIARWMLCSKEKRSVRLLCPACQHNEAVRYVVLDARAVSQYFLANAVFLGIPLDEYNTQENDDFTVGTGTSTFRLPHRTYGPRYEGSIAARLYLHDGWDVGRYRLVYASAHKSYTTYILDAATGDFWRTSYPIDSMKADRAFSTRTRENAITWDGGFFEYDGLIAPTVKIFEKVEGARLIGVVRPGSVVEVHMELRCGAEGRPVRYGRTAVATANGEFEMVVSHPTGVAPPYSTCAGDDQYVLYVRPEPDADPSVIRGVKVDEADIQDGETIDLGRL